MCFQNGEEVSKGHTLLLKDASFDTAGTFVCVVTALEVEGLESSAALRVHVLGVFGAFVFVHKASKYLTVLCLVLMKVVFD